MSSPTRRTNFSKLRRRFGKMSSSRRRRRRSISSTSPARLRGQAVVELGRQPGGQRQVLRLDRRPPRLGARATRHGRATPSSTSTIPDKKTFRQLVDVREAAQPARRPLHARQDPQPARPGRRRLALLLHAPRLDDGRPPTSTTTRATGSSAAIPRRGKTEVVAHGPVPKHCIPTSVLDPKRLIFYGGTAPGSGGRRRSGIQFFAYDVKNKKRALLRRRTARRAT